MSFLYPHQFRMELLTAYRPGVSQCLTPHNVDLRDIPVPHAGCIYQPDCRRRGKYAHPNSSTESCRSIPPFFLRQKVRVQGKAHSMGISIIMRKLAPGSTSKPGPRVTSGATSVISAPSKIIVPLTVINWHAP